MTPVDYARLPMIPVEGSNGTRRKPINVPASVAPLWYDMMTVAGGITELHRAVMPMLGCDSADDLAQLVDRTITNPLEDSYLFSSTSHLVVCWYLPWGPNNFRWAIKKIPLSQVRAVNYWHNLFSIAESE